MLGVSSCPWFLSGPAAVCCRPELSVQVISFTLACSRVGRAESGGGNSEVAAWDVRWESHRPPWWSVGSMSFLKQMVNQPSEMGNRINWRKQEPFSIH